MAKYVRKKSSTKYKKSTSKQAKAVVKATKFLMLKSVETKYYPIDCSIPLVSNSLYTVSPTQQIAVGNTASTRIGDSILLQSLQLNGYFHVDSLATNVKVRLLVGWSKSQVVNLTMSSSGLGVTDIFHAMGGEVINRIVNPSSFTSLIDVVFDINSNTTTTKDLRSFYFKEKLGMTKFDYTPLGGSLGKKRNLFIAVICQEVDVGPGLPVCVGQFCSKLMYKDP